MLDDKARLRGHTISTRLAASAPKANETLDCRFEIGSVPHVVHMTIKPQEIIDEEDAKIAKSGGRDQDGNRRSAGCRCVIL